MENDMLDLIPQRTPEELVELLRESHKGIALFEKDGIETKLVVIGNHNPQVDAIIESTKHIGNEGIHQVAIMNKEDPSYQKVMSGEPLEITHPDYRKSETKLGIIAYLVMQAQEPDSKFLEEITRSCLAMSDFDGVMKNYRSQSIAEQQRMPQSRLKGTPTEPKYFGMAKHYRR